MKYGFCTLGESLAVLHFYINEKGGEALRVDVELTLCTNSVYTIDACVPTTSPLSGAPSVLPGTSWIWSMPSRP